LSDKVPTNDELARLLTFPNVLVTSHMATFSRIMRYSQHRRNHLGNFAEFDVAPGSAIIIIGIRKMSG
jgi:phosphoglycerate dehydrogenase-like enzyme